MNKLKELLFRAILPPLVALVISFMILYFFPHIPDKIYIDLMIIIFMSSQVFFITYYNKKVHKKDVL